MSRTTQLAILGVLGIAASGCGRSTVFECVVGVAPTSLDFGSTPFGTPVSRSVTVSSLYNDGCAVTGIALGPGSDPGFALQGGGRFGIEPETEMPITVTFSPAMASPHAAGSLVFETSDPLRPSFSIPMTGTVLACDLSTPDAGVDFGMVSLGDAATQSLPVTNLGLATCEVTVALTSQSDPGFSIPGSQPTSLSIAPGTSALVSVQFEAGVNLPPDVRAGMLTIKSNDPLQPMVTAPLSAQLPVCMLGIVPPALDFGNITLNGSATDQVILVNDGGADCNVSGLALAAGSDPDFSLPVVQPTSFTVAPGQQVPVSVTFSDLSGVTPPFLRTGTLDFDTGDPVNPMAQVPLEAYVNVACVAASQWVYTVDEAGRFARFDPATLTFTDIGVLSCPTQFGGTPFSMAVDQNAVAWVVYDSGELFQVDTSTAACQATTFQIDQSGINVFGMSFVFQPTTGLDTLYVVGAGSNFNTSDDLATISFPGLALTPIAPVPIGGGELAGTGDGELWDFMPDDPDAGVILAQLDTATAAILSIIPLANVESGGSFATKFWGGSFWIFVADRVYQVPRTTGLASLVIAHDGYNIVGAGVSTCAPVQ